MRALFEMALHERLANLAVEVLTLTKAVDQSIWPMKNPLRQLHNRDVNFLLNGQPNERPTVDEIKQLSAEEIGVKFKKEL